jgi:hypothetical protein
MAIQKQGLDYFDLSVDFFDDDKIALVEAEMGIAGSYIALRLLAKIYRSNGYYLQWGEDERLLFARSLSLHEVSADTVQRAVDLLLKRDFFDRETYEAHGVLTSKAIQRRYFNAVKRRNADNKDRKYYLLEDSAYIMQTESPIMSTESPKMSTESPKMSTESKKERSKERIRVEKSREEESRVEAPPQTPPHGEREVGVSESRGGAFSVFTSQQTQQIRSLLERAAIPKNEIWEFVRLTASPEYRPADALNIAREYSEKRAGPPFYEIIQSLQQLEGRGRLHPVPFQHYMTMLYLHHNIRGSDLATIQRMVADPRLEDELEKLVKEVTRPGSGINQPGKFIIAGLRKMQGALPPRYLNP